MPTASTAVFLRPELVEAILLELLPRSLLLAQRVNKTFRKLIDNSVEMQCKLFFQAPSALTPHKDTRNVINPFLARIVQRKFEGTVSIPKANWAFGTNPIRDSSNKRIPQRLPDRTNCWPKRTHLWVNVECEYSPFKVPVDEGSSWRKMLVAYEPITFELHWDSIDEEYIDFDYESCRPFYAAEMSDIVDKIARFIAARPPLSTMTTLERYQHGGCDNEAFKQTYDDEYSSDDDAFDDEDSDDEEDSDEEGSNDEGSNDEDSDSVIDENLESDFA